MTTKIATPPVLTFEDYSAADIAGAQAEAAEAAITAKECREELRDLVCSVDQIELLSRLALRAILGLHSFGTSKHDPAIHAHELEFLQALALSRPRSPNADPYDIARVMDRLVPLVREHTLAVQKMSHLRLSSDPEKNKVEAILDRIRATTYTVRGPRHAYQTRAYLRDFAAALDGRFLAALGWSATQLIDCLEGFAIRTGDELTALRERLRPSFLCDDASKCLDMFRADHPEQRSHPLLADLDAAAPLPEIKAVLFAIFEGQLPPVFRLDGAGAHPDFEMLRAKLTEMALGFGDVSDEDLEHLKLGNPVRSKPFVADGAGGLRLFCTQTMYSYLVELIEELVDDRAALKDACGKFKATWLEERLEALTRKAFPAGEVIVNAKWRDLADKAGETDCILAMDQTVGLFEAKSGRISAPARRGAPGRLKTKIDELLVDPSRQSARFADLLTSTKEAVEVELDGGRARIAPSAIREIVRFNILFDTLGPLTAGTRQLVDAGFIPADAPMAPSMSIFELETLFELLPDQISRLHYLRRRAELEAVTTFEADEMDLIAFYLETSFCMAQLEQEKYGFSIYGWSDRIARLYTLDGLGPVPRNLLKRTPFLRTLIDRIGSMQQPGWTRFGFRLCNIAYRDQFELQRRREGLAKKARRIKDGQAVHVGFARESERDRSAVALCVGKSVSPFGIEQHGRKAAKSVMEQSNASHALLLYWDVADRAADCRYTATFSISDEALPAPR
jgi:hypothetical protein